MQKLTTKKILNQPSTHQLNTKMYMKDMNYDMHAVMGKKNNLKSKDTWQTQIKQQILTIQVDIRLEI